ncbi:hypothetical protein ACJJTC_019262 [Scirpophaga incertulas]
MVLCMWQTFTRLLWLLLEEEGQVSTLWLQCVLLFALLWGLCGTLQGDSRKMFDTFFRKLLDGGIAAYPKPKAFKLTKNQLFPDKGDRVRLRLRQAQQRHLDPVG